ncbi:SusD/RagB family nutrient-binding outer membrane lipoprotein [Flexithrix dorotheae]|uniref:SusD/RagB family nutrient-binding outer membrane lipoprotein n=1 Tax=Flexithrix dorotheae TaxID=70993 RepID=UPI00036550FE|nr:SusD/RagB family nutrient-binding outer membrane lipoprotein [Flexithrix dorotheae]
MKILIRNLAFYILLLMGFSSCEEYLDINDDPYLPQTAPPALYLPQVIYSMAEGDMFDSRYVGSITQNWSYGGTGYFSDRHGSSYYSGVQKFRNHYWTIGSNLNQMVVQAEEAGQPVYAGIAKIIRAYSWQITTDHHGELPYVQAWDNTLTQFDYDSQEFIYGEILKLCDEGIEMLGNLSGEIDPDFAASDYLYNGDIEKWIKFGYAIKARNLGHLSNKNTFNPDMVISMVDQSFGNVTDNASVQFAGESSATSSFMGPSRGNFNFRYPSSLFVSYLDGTYSGGVEDPRLTLMLNPDENGEYTGIPPTVGDTAGIATTFYGKYIFNDSDPYPLISYFELQFIKAEAAFIKGDKGTAFSAFVEGVKSHMEFAGAEAAAISDFIANGLPANADALSLSDIMTQKYIALFTNNETWSDLRRYDYSSEVFKGFTLPEELTVTNDGKPAERWYPRQYSEVDWNSDALEEIGGLEPDFNTKPVWFTEAD